LQNVQELSLSLAAPFFSADVFLRLDLPDFHFNLIFRPPFGQELWCKRKIHEIICVKLF